jgi:RimJ/RimL family protein N-acetyltransferase
MIPTLETERLLMRGWKPDDFEPYARFMADEDVTRHLTGAVLSRTDAWRNLAAVIGHWTLRGYGMWAIERKSDRAFIGRVGLWNPEGWPQLEVGWTLGKEYWGQGYAYEAGRRAMDYAFLTQDVDRMISVIQKNNVPSQKVAERLGETKGERREIGHSGKTFEVDIWSISREAWRARH